MVVDGDAGARIFLLLRRAAMLGEAALSQYLLTLLKAASCGSDCGLWRLGSGCGNDSVEGRWRLADRPFLRGMSGSSGVHAPVYLPFELCL